MSQYMKMKIYWFLDLSMHIKMLKKRKFHFYILSYGLEINNSYIGLVEICHSALILIDSDIRLYRNLQITKSFVFLILPLTFILIPQMF